MKRLSKRFFARPTLYLVKALLGKCIVRKIGKRKIIGRVIETEAYYGFQDKASHASRGRTKRTEVMFEESGHLYIYLIYGMYYCMNIVTEEKNFPAAILIRAVEPIKNMKKTNGKIKMASQPEVLCSRVLAGPGKVCRWLKIDDTFNREDLSTSKRIWLEDCKGEGRFSIGKSSRIGVDYAGRRWAKKEWRFFILPR